MKYKTTARMDTDPAMIYFKTLLISVLNTLALIMALIAPINPPSAPPIKTRRIGKPTHTH